MKAGEVLIVNFTPSVGDEITKSRPAIVIEPDDITGLKLRVVVPLTDASKFVRNWHVKIKPDNMNNLTKESIADIFQLKSASTQRFIKKIGIISDEDLVDIKLCITDTLCLI